MTDRAPRASDHRTEEIAAVHRVLLDQGKGRTNAIKAPQLSRLAGIEHGEGASGGNGAGSRLRVIVSAANECGIVICSGPEGYWLPTSAAEVHRAAQTLRAKGRAAITRADLMERNAERIFGATQMRLLA